MGGRWRGYLSALEEPIVASNDYLQIVLLSFFARITTLNHFPKLVQRFDSYKGTAKREILLAASGNSLAGPWLTTLKGSFWSIDWQRRAFLLAARKLPKDERKFWLRGISPKLEPLEKEIARESSG